jgi:cobalamin biosynthesis protein CbiG
MGLAQAMIVAGLGCRRGARPADVAAAIALALEQYPTGWNHPVGFIALENFISRAAYVRSAEPLRGSIRPDAALRDRAPAGLTRLATSEARSREPGLLEAAAALGLALEAVPQAALAAEAARCLTRSGRSLAETGLPSLAEAAALAAAGPGAVLLGPRVAVARAVTCALAAWPA